MTIENQLRTRVYQHSQQNSTDWDSGLLAGRFEEDDKHLILNSNDKTGQNCPDLNLTKGTTQAKMLWNNPPIHL